MRDDQHRDTTSGSGMGGMASPGALLAGALAGLVMRRTGVIGAVGAAAGAAWLYQKMQAEGRLPGLPRMPVHVRRDITIDRPRAEVFKYWRDPTNFSSFMAHVQSVEKTGPDRHHWTVRAPMGQILEWDAILHDIEEGRRIRWRAVPPTQIHNEGEVWFEDAPGGGTHVRLSLTYDAPGGRMGQVIARIMGEEPGVQADEDLRRLKEILESDLKPETEA